MTHYKMKTVHSSYKKKLAYNKKYQKVVCVTQFVCCYVYLSFNTETALIVQLD